MNKLYSLTVFVGLVGVYGVYPDAIHDAVKSGNLDQIKKELKDGVNLRDADGVTPLLLAVEEGRVDVVKMLLDAGADPNAQDNKFKVTPLHSAISEEIAEALIEAGAKLDVQDEAGETPLHAIVLDDYRSLGESRIPGGNSYTKVAACLIKHGADVNKANIDGKTPLHSALTWNNLDMAELLLENKADVNAITNDEDEEMNGTVLHQAVVDRSYNDGKKPFIELFIKYHADVNARDANGATPLMLAVEQERIDVVNMLLDAGADPNAKDNNNIAPLLRVLLPREDASRFCFSSRQVEIAHLLINHGAHVTEKYNVLSGVTHTALGLAVCADEYELVKSILEKGADVNETMSAVGIKTPPLEIATSYGNTDMINLLLSYGADAASSIRMMKKFIKQKENSTIELPQFDESGTGKVMAHYMRDMVERPIERDREILAILENAAK